MDPGPGDGKPRLYELRLTPITDESQRVGVARWLARRFPPREIPTLVRALEGPGFITRLELREKDAPALIRELYAAGAPPVAVFLLPVDAGGRRREEEQATTRAFTIFARRGGRFVPTWNWWAFVLGPLWYFRNGLYAKGLVLLVASLVPVWSLPVTLLVSLAILVYCGLVGNWDRYLWRVKRTQWW